MINDFNFRYMRNNPQNGALVRKARCDVNKDIKHVVKKTQD